MVTLSIGWLIAALLVALLAGLAIAWPWRSGRTDRRAAAQPTGSGARTARRPEPCPPAPGPGPGPERAAVVRPPAAANDVGDPATVAREQAAVLRLMDELDPVARGDLTARATVGPELAGAIAETINFTLDELQALVARVDGTATAVRMACESAAAASAAACACAGRRSGETDDVVAAVTAMAGRMAAIAEAAVAAASAVRGVADAAGTDAHAVRAAAARVGRVAASAAADAAAADALVRDLGALLRETDWQAEDASRRAASAIDRIAATIGALAESVARFRIAR